MTDDDRDPVDMQEAGRAWMDGRLNGRDYFALARRNAGDDVNDDPDQPITVKVIAHHMPVTAQQLLDAGLPLPPGMEPPPPVPRPSRYQRLRWAYRERVHNVRERVGFWIAGYTPDESDW